jgi:hypothetical protein
VLIGRLLVASYLGTRFGPHGCWKQHICSMLFVLSLLLPSGSQIYVKGMKCFGYHRCDQSNCRYAFEAIGPPTAVHGCCKHVAIAMFLPGRAQWAPVQAYASSCVEAFSLAATQRGALLQGCWPLQDWCMLPVAHSCLCLGLECLATS